MQTIKLNGTVRTIGEVIDKGSFKSQVITINVDAETNYPQVFSVQFANKNIDLLCSVILGDNVELECNLKGKVWVNGKGEEVIFTTIDCFKLKNI